VSRHVSAEILALHREGGMTEASAAKIDAHLADCARCSGLDAALTNLAGVLATTELPPMPEALTVRIQMAIVHESAARAGTSAASAAVRADGARASGSAPPAVAATDGHAQTGSGHVPGRPDLPGRRRRRSPRLRMPDWSSPVLLRGLAAAAAVVVIVGAGILIANARNTSQSGGAAGTGGGTRPSAHRVGGGKLSNNAEASGPMTVSYRLNGKIATTTAVVGHHNMTPKSLPRIVLKRFSNLITLGGDIAAPRVPQAALPKFRIGGLSISALQGCLSAIAAGRQVMVADVGRFLGRPATIVVLRSLTAADILDVAVVGRGCSASNLDIIRTLTVPFP
jgi:hypothetical protein